MTLALTLSTFSSAGGTSTTFVGLATTATSLITGNNYQGNSLGIGTAASGVAGEIRAAGNITGFYSSDAKFKENIQIIPNALAAVVAIGGKTFDWTEEYIRHHGGAPAPVPGSGWRTSFAAAAGRRDRKSAATPEADPLAGALLRG